MNIHKSIDNLSIKIGGLYGERFRFFRDGIETEPIESITRNLEMDFTPPTENGEYHIPIRYKSFEGTARYSLLNWAGVNRPCLIFHHGSGETNYTGRILKILPKTINQEINLIAVSIPCNQDMKEYLYGIGSVERFCTLMASSVRIFEALNDWLKKIEAGKVIASGISLGGWITNLHYSLYNSIDEYRPIFAGAALDHLFTATVYRQMTSKAARGNPAIIKKALNFEEAFTDRDSNNIFPLLARYDQYIDFNRQRNIYPERQLKIIEKGHITGTMTFNALKNHLIEGLGIYIN